MLLDYIKKVAAQRGWNDQTVIALLCDFIALGNDPDNGVIDRLDEFLKEIIEVENELCE